MEDEKINFWKKEERGSEDLWTGTVTLMCGCSDSTYMTVSYTTM